MGLKEIGNKIFKQEIELSSDELELANIKDLDAMFKSSATLISLASKELKSIDPLAKKMKETSAIIEELEVEMKKAIKENNSVSMMWGNALTDLGNLRQDMTAKLKEYSKAYNDVGIKAKQLGVDIDLKKHLAKINELGKVRNQAKNYM